MNYWSILLCSDKWVTFGVTLHRDLTQPMKKSSRFFSQNVRLAIYNQTEKISKLGRILKVRREKILITCALHEHFFACEKVWGFELSKLVRGFVSGVATNDYWCQTTNTLSPTHLKSFHRCRNTHPAALIMRACSQARMLALFCVIFLLDCSSVINNCHGDLVFLIAVACLALCACYRCRRLYITPKVLRGCFKSWGFHAFLHW